MWPQVDLGFKLWPPVLKRQQVDQGQVESKQLRKVEVEKKRNARHVASLNTSRKHAMRLYDSDAPPPAPPKPKRKRAKKQKEVITEGTASASAPKPKRKRAKNKEIITEAASTCISTPLRLASGTIQPARP